MREKRPVRYVFVDLMVTQHRKPPTALIAQLCTVRYMEKTYPMGMRWHGHDGRRRRMFRKDEGPTQCWQQLKETYARNATWEERIHGSFTVWRASHVRILSESLQEVKRHSARASKTFETSTYFKNKVREDDRKARKALYGSPVLSPGGNSAPVVLSTGR